MHRYLLIKAFEKAKEKKGSYVWHQAKHISTYMMTKHNEPFSPRSLVNYYKKSKKNSQERIELREGVVTAVCKYLNCDDLEEFKEKYPNENLPIDSPKLGFKVIMRITVFILLFFVISGFLVMFSLNKPKWMVWEEDHYVEVSFDTNKYKISELKLYDEDRVSYFKKITPDCETEFFKPDGLENLWYGKSAKGELEFFTALGKHPETGKTLKPITAYMIRKYICDTYK